MHYIHPRCVVSRRPSGAGRTPLEEEILEALREEPAHAYALARRLDATLSARQAARRGLSRILRRLEAMQLVEGTWVTDSDAGPPRRQYHLTELGVEVLGKRADRDSI